MTYRWTPEGPVFEFPTPYGTENRLLGVMGCWLLACAIGLALVLQFVDAGQGERPVFGLEKLPDKASLVPHVLAAAWLVVLGLMNLWRAKQQRMLSLLPGQPASLMFEVAREGMGAGSGADRIFALLDGMPAPAAPAQGAYAAWLARLGAAVAEAPSSLHAFLNQRMSNLLCWVGLMVILALWAVASLWLPQPAAWPAAAGLLAGVAAGLCARRVLNPEGRAPAPWLVAVLLLMTLLLSAAAGSGAGHLPGGQQLAKSGLPIAVVVLLAGAVLIEALGILAARGQLTAVVAAGAASEVIKLGADVSVDPDLMLREMELELHRRWTEGVPNRRYARQLTPGTDALGQYAMLVLEESQPVVPTPARGQAVVATPHGPSRAGLLGLSVVSALFSGAGGVLWMGQAYAKMQDGSATWAAGSAGLMCLLLGAYALRVAHMLWSRVEVQSTITWLEFAGCATDQDARAAHDNAVSGQRATTRLTHMTLRARVARARSVFYAASTRGIGTRALLDLQPFATEARTWTAFLRSSAGQVNAPPQAPQPVEPNPSDRVGEVHRPHTETPAPVTRAPRFCSTCGTPVLHGARFCQHCGQGLAGP